MTIEAMTQIAADELVQQVETAKGFFPGSRVKVRRGRVIVLAENLIMLEPFVWALQNEQSNLVEQG
jgi:hypothetical protein